MKTTTLNTILDRLITSEKNNEVLRQKNIGLNARAQSLESQIKQMKTEIIALKGGVDISGTKALNITVKESY